MFSLILRFTRCWSSVCPASSRITPAASLVRRPAKVASASSSVCERRSWTTRVGWRDLLAHCGRMLRSTVTLLFIPYSPFASPYSLLSILYAFTHSHTAGLFRLKVPGSFPWKKSAMVAVITVPSKQSRLSRSSAWSSIPGKTQGGVSRVPLRCDSRGFPGALLNYGRDHAAV